jgi:isoleucyl-tRNA synthetase
MLCIVSAVTLERAPEGQPAQLDVTVTRASGDKCPRCWRYVPALVPAGGDDAVCPRCEEAVLVA